MTRQDCAQGSGGRLAGLLIAVWAACGSDAAAEDGAGGLEFAPYGQLHFAYQAVDDGQVRTGNIVDVTNANSRVGFYLRPRGGDPDSGLSFHFETGLGFRPSQKTSQIATPPAWDWARTDLRKVQLIWSTTAGTLKLGQGSMPTDGAAESDLGGTVVVAKSTIPEANGAYILRTASGALSSVTIGDAFDNFDGGRKGRIRFDTAPVAGVSLAVAYGREILKSGVDDDYYDIALRYGKTFDRVEVKAAAGMAYTVTPGANPRTFLGSVSVFDRPTGLNLSLAAGRASLTGGRYGYLKAGWNAQAIAAGPTKLVAEFYRGSDQASAGDRSTMWSVGVIQDLEAYGTEIYAGYRHFSYADQSATGYLDAGALQVGARWRF